MNAEKFFEKHTIEEISQKTKISPISLRFIRNKEFDKIPRAKFFGFINIIEKEYNVDLSDLKEEYNLTAPKKEETQEIITETKEKKNYLLFILAFLLLIIGGFVLYSTLNTNRVSAIDTNTSLSKTSLKPLNDQNNSAKSTYTEETNTSDESNKNIPIKTPFSNKTDTSLKSTSPLQSKKNKYKKQKYPVDIIPNKIVWFKAINIDTNKTIEFLTSKEKILPKGNYYIKFGHGEITVNYGNQTITPNTKKIIRILFKDGNYTFMKKPNRFER